jgi:tetratricopeptide (TPR) repeat protein
LQRYASVSLFTERAHAADPGFELTAENAAAVAEICRRLDGLPLAIELAAARVTLLPPQVLLSRLDERFTVLTGGARDLPERQRTLRNTLDWSFGLLTADEQELFGRLGVFAGSFSLSAAEAVGAVPHDEGRPRSSGQVIDTLGSLVDSSLVRLETRGAEPRFALLETVRAYALERLGEGDGWVQAHDQHAAHFLAYADPDVAELTRLGQRAWLDLLETDHDNLWAAMSWLVDHGPLERAVDLFMVTWRFWWLRGHAAELVRLGGEVAARSTGLPPDQHAKALTSVGFILIANGDRERARQVFEQSLPLYQQVSHKQGVAFLATTVAALGHLAACRREFADAGRLLGQSKALLGTLGDDLTGFDRLQQLLTGALTDNFLGQVRLAQGDNEEAARLFAEGLAVGRREGDSVPILVSLYDLALARQAQGDLVGAASHLKEGLALAADAGDETSIACFLELLATDARRRDDPERAVRLLAAARSMLAASGSGWLHAYVQRSFDESVIRGLRVRMGEAAFEDARAWGGSAGRAEAVEYALGQG